MEQAGDDESGAVGVIACVKEGEVVCAGVGDCGCLLVKGDGEVVDLGPRITPDFEAERVGDAGGWITHETELYIPNLKRLDLKDPFVRRVLEGRSGEERSTGVSRVCGELSVSR